MSKLKVGPAANRKRYEKAMNLLDPGEQEALKACFGNFKVEVHKLQGVLTDWLFDENNWTDFGQYGKSVSDALVDDQFAPSREPILTLFRHVRANESFAGS